MVTSLPALLAHSTNKQQCEKTTTIDYPFVEKNKTKNITLFWVTLPLHYKANIMVNSVYISFIKLLQETYVPGNASEELILDPLEVLPYKKRNQEIFRYKIENGKGVFELMYAREVSAMSHMETDDALMVPQYPIRLSLAMHLKCKGFYWLKTGFVRDLSIRSGTHYNQDLENLYNQPPNEVHENVVFPS